eukprot:TRINITY_DN2724_c2_g1_i1.p1 TRINITY_DN2724_c2_g1~~TRINITY_DN2724_c2_g1_i1.p1  ORF type:complete len:359 (-),score=76.06 TRINITY_DN2724_c2_g1_i1:23-1024(-)
MSDLKHIRREDLKLKPVLANVLWNAIERHSKKQVYMIDIAIGKSIGEGAFGTVYEGIWLKSTKVALKKLNDETISTAAAKEVALMSKFRHPNIVSYLGMFQDSRETMYIVTEFLENGSLLDLLRHKGPFSKDQLVKMAKDVVAGMIYLHSEKIVHRDLAARNLLVDQSNVIKVADFGLSDSIYDQIGRHTQIPVRWSAPEALKKESFTAASDVYSFGCVLYEMFTGGDHPWDTLDNNAQVTRAVCDGKIMEKRPSCPDDVYQLMCECWKYNPKERPTMITVLEKLNAIPVEHKKTEEKVEKTEEKDEKTEEKDGKSETVDKRKETKQPTEYDE